MTQFLFPPEKILADIQDTQEEINDLERQLRVLNMQEEAVEKGIKERERFIEKLTAILQERETAQAEAKG
jgi:hypothetical protein